MLKTVRYVGPIDAVALPLPSGLVATVERGASVDVPAGLAERLLEQTDWAAPASEEKSAKKTTPPAGGKEVTTDAGR